MRQGRVQKSQRAGVKASRNPRLLEENYLLPKKAHAEREKSLTRQVVQTPRKGKAIHQKLEKAGNNDVHAFRLRKESVAGSPRTFRTNRNKVAHHSEKRVKEIRKAQRDCLNRIQARLGIKFLGKKKRTLGRTQEGQSTRDHRGKKK